MYPIQRQTKERSDDLSRNPSYLDGVIRRWRPVVSASCSTSHLVLWLLPAGTLSSTRLGERLDAPLDAQLCNFNVWVTCWLFRGRQFRYYRSIVHFIFHWSCHVR